jgi:hypothetical protein
MAGLWGFVEGSHSPLRSLCSWQSTHRFLIWQFNTDYVNWHSMVPAKSEKQLSYWKKQLDNAWLWPLPADRRVLPCRAIKRSLSFISIHRLTASLKSLTRQEDDTVYDPARSLSNPVVYYRAG